MRQHPNLVVYDVLACPRCEVEHHGVTFAKLAKPIRRTAGLTVPDVYTHAATCPVTGEPILVAITQAIVG